MAVNTVHIIEDHSVDTMIPHGATLPDLNSPHSHSNTQLDWTTYCLYSLSTH